jgi:Flp pilus assembly protein CpaB
MPFLIGGGALAVLTFVGVILYTNSAGGTVAPGTVPVVVAAHDLQIRIPIQSTDLMVVNYHADDAPPGAFAHVVELKGTIASVNITKGQPVTANLVVTSTDSVIGPQAAFLPIPSGFVALTIPTGEQQGVAGYIGVGDYLSMVAQVQGKTTKNVRTVYTNIPVIRVGASTQGTGTTAPKTGGLSNSLTVVVTQCQAEFIEWFLANGQLSYTLESYKDYSPQTAVDPACKTVDAAKGVTQADVSAHWVGIFN